MPKFGRSSKTLSAFPSVSLVRLMSSTSSKLALQEAFPFVPSRYLEAEFRLHRHFYGTFQAIAKAERQYNTDAQKSYTKLKCRRYNSAKSSQGLLHSLGAHHFDVTNLELEMEEAKKRKVQDDSRSSHRSSISTVLYALRSL